MSCEREEGRGGWLACIRTERMRLQPNSFHLLFSLLHDVADGDDDDGDDDYDDNKHDDKDWKRKQRKGVDT